MQLEFRRLRESDLDAWRDFTDTCYYPGHILTDIEHLRWYLGGPSHNPGEPYETLVAVDKDDRIVGNYGVLPMSLWVNGRLYPFCWFINAMVRPELRNQGIGKKFIDLLLDRFEICGGLGFNHDVKRNYARFGFEFFGERSLRRFILPLSSSAYDLVEAIGFDRIKAEALVPLSTPMLPQATNAVPIARFDNGVEACTGPDAIKSRVYVERSADYLNWRYIRNPRVHYECRAVLDQGRWLGYLAARRERYLPTKHHATRILDLVGEPNSAEHLLKDSILRAHNRGDVMIEFLFTGRKYETLLMDLGFAELCGQAFEWWPQVTTPIQPRPNHEILCLGSRRHPGLFREMPYEDLYITRGDSDRDRANRLKAEQK